jgi:hypothetical protein
MVVIVIIGCVEWGFQEERWRRRLEVSEALFVVSIERSLKNATRLYPYSHYVRTRQVARRAYPLIGVGKMKFAKFAAGLDGRFTRGERRAFLAQ